MEFSSTRLKELVKAAQRPIVFITSNNEKELPDAFSPRCFFHYIRFPDKETMEKIDRGALPGLKSRSCAKRSRCSSRCAKCRGLKKKPSTSELLDWLKLLLARTFRPTPSEPRTARTIIPAAARGAVEKRAGRASLRASYLHVAPALVVPARMLSGFFVKLKDHKIPVSIKEWLTLLEAMQKTSSLHHRFLFGERFSSALSSHRANVELDPRPLMPLKYSAGKRGRLVDVLLVSSPASCATGSRTRRSTAR